MDKRSLLGAFVVAAALFAVFPFVYGKYQEVGAFRLALEDRELLVADRQSALDNFTREHDRYRTQLTGDVADKFGAMVPVTRGTAELVSSIDGIARESAITLAGVSFTQARRSGAATNALTLSLEAEGTYENFMAFLASVERSVRLMDIQNFEVNTQEDGTLQFDVTLLTYFVQ